MSRACSYTYGLPFLTDRSTYNTCNPHSSHSAQGWEVQDGTYCMQRRVASEPGVDMLACCSHRASVLVVHDGERPNEKDVEEEEHRKH